MTKTRVVCMDCGGKFSPQLVARKRAICPVCPENLTKEHDRYVKKKRAVIRRRDEIEKRETAL